MSANCNFSRFFSCCRKYQNSVCFKLWILIFVCSLLCFTCLLIENRRNGLIKRRNITTKQAAQKLIQIKSTFNNLNNKIAKDDAIEESSGNYAENVDLQLVNKLDLAKPYLIEENDPRMDYHASDHSHSQEMPAASNCITKSSNFPTTQANNGNEMNEYDCKELLKQTEQALEYRPELRQTKDENILFDYETQAPEEYQQVNEYEWINNLEEEPLLPLHVDNNDEPIFELSIEPQNTAANAWDSDDRFFPDEYAFHISTKEEILPTEASLIDKSLNELLREQLTPSDIPSMIDTFLGKISTLFAPPINIRPYTDPAHLSNFKDIPLNTESMKFASSKVNPIWQSGLNSHTSNHGRVLKSPFSLSSHSNLKRKRFVNHEDATLLPKLLEILREH